jgi:hypothetical protein
MILRVKNWREFQHYGKRRPPWIKLHHKLLDDRVFLTLPVASRALAPMVWLLASESEDGSIKDAITEITFRLRMSEQDAREALAPLLAHGFLIDASTDASSALSSVEESRGRGEAPSGLPPHEDQTSSPVAARDAPEGALTHAIANLANKLKAKA